MPVELTVDQQAVTAVAEAMKAEADGKALRRDLLREIRAVGAPIVPDVQSAVRSLPDVSAAAGSPSLRDAIAAQTKVSARMSGRYTGLRIWISGKANPRGFRSAARVMNRRRGWRHPVYGNPDAWVNQSAGDKWFEGAVLKHRQQARDAVLDAVEAMARRIAERAQQEADK